MYTLLVVCLLVELALTVETVDDFLLTTVVARALLARSPDDRATTLKSSLLCCLRFNRGERKNFGFSGNSGTFNVVFSNKKTKLLTNTNATAMNTSDLLFNFDCDTRSESMIS